MTKEEKIICKDFLNDVDKTHSCNEYKLLMALLEQEPKEITLEDVKGYCKPRCLTIISNELYHELTHSKIKVLDQEPRCKECKWWKDSDGAYRRGLGAESQCPINNHTVYCGEGYCYMFSPRQKERLRNDDRWSSK